MEDELLLLNPGPVPVHPQVRAAMDAPMISRRSDEFAELYDRVRDGLSYVFTRSTPDGSRTATGGTPLVLNGTATMGMEAAVANLVRPDDEVVALVNGQFSDRFAWIAEKYATVHRIDADWGRSFDVGAVEDVIDDARLVVMVHNETSTGLSNPVEEVGAIVAEHDALFAVDGVSSIGGEEFRIDDWGVDVAITDPQKALASPPGISALYLSETAIDELNASGRDASGRGENDRDASDRDENDQRIGARTPAYQDLRAYLTAAETGATPYTAASPQFRALAVALELIEDEGMPDRIDRHRRWADAVRSGVRSMGLEPFAKPTGGSSYTNTLTAVALPDGVRGDADRFFDGLAERNVSVGGGLGHLDGELFRMSNMGHLSPEQLCYALRAVGESLGDAGADVDVDAGVETLEERLS